MRSEGGQERRQRVGGLGQEWSGQREAATAQSCTRHHTISSRILLSMVPAPCRKAVPHLQDPGLASICHLAQVDAGHSGPRARRLLDGV